MPDAIDAVARALAAANREGPLSDYENAQIAVSTYLRVVNAEATVNACEQCGTDGVLSGGRPLLCHECSQHSEGPLDA